jgi:hypothetical protein
MEIKSALACLFIEDKDDNYEKVIDNLKNLNNFKFICFDNNEKNKKLYTLLKSEKEQCLKEESEDCDQT